MPTVIGPHPLAKDERGRLKTRIGTVFPYDNTVVTLSGIHAAQREAYLDLLDQARCQRGEGPMSPEQRKAEWHKAVDLIMEEDKILIRPDPDNMELAFAADEVLSELVPTRQVRFLNVLNQKVRDAIKRRGQCWRITPMPKSPREMRQMIAGSRIGISGQEIYYFNNATGTRLLTCEEFARLGALEPEALRQHLIEIQEFSARYNRLGNPEIDFFLAGGALSREDFACYDFARMGPEELQEVHRALAAKFREAVPPELRRDDPHDLEWRNRMFSALIPPQEEVVSEETMLRLSSEFFMQIEWLPGARIEQGEVILDPCFQEPHPSSAADQEEDLWGQKARGFIFNFIREFGDLEYINVGRVIGSLSRRRESRGRREVYIAEIKQRDNPEEIVKIIRMQKWGVREHLDQNKSLLQAMMESEEYTEYVLDRRLACRQLGMNITARVTSWKLSETYYGPQWEYRGITINSPYFERDYVRGIATDKIPSARFENPEYAIRFASLLGRAAAPNMIVGRCDFEGKVVFDDGDEVVREDASGLPVEIIVSDQMGTFNDYTRRLEHFARAYADPVNRRLPLVCCPREFATAYLEGFQQRFRSIQQEYFRRKRAFDTLFGHRRWDPKGSFRYRWEQVLKRLQETNPETLTEAIRRHVALK
ncbi:MAG: hypothetical protein ACUVUC_09110 [Thermoguttaceae bacterium]